MAEGKLHKLRCNTREVISLGESLASLLWSFLSTLYTAFKEINEKAAEKNLKFQFKCGAS